MDGLKKVLPGLNTRAKKYVDSIMSDGQPRTHIKIIDDMKKLIIEGNKNSGRSSKTGHYIIPTINELQFYLIHNYTKVGRDKFTNYLIYQKK